jgi:phosphomannomutase
MTTLFEQAEAWRAADPDPDTRAELAALLERRDEQAEKELQERFAGPLTFGTAGLRGIVGAGPSRMNRAVIRRTTAGLARYLKATLPDVARRGVVVGRDARRMSRELAEDTALVLAAEGIPALVFDDVVPTPLTAFATTATGAAAAVMVTASHNPPEYNGYKVYWGNGAQIIPPHDQGIAAAIDAVEPASDVRLLTREDAMARGLFKSLRASTTGTGDLELGPAYLNAILALRRHQKPAPLTLVYTALHGVGGPWVLEALRRSGFMAVHSVPEQHAPDGRFPTVRFPNPEEPGAMDLSLALAERTGAALVLANDPDADRLAVCVRHQGKMRQLTGNEVGVLLGHYTLTQRPSGSAALVITTIVSSPQLSNIARDLGARYDETLTGFKWIANRALERGAREGLQFVFGYEEALGYCVGQVTRDKDGISAALLVADLAAWCHARGWTLVDYLEDIERRHGLYVASQKSFTFPGAAGARTMATLMETLRREPPGRIGDFAVVALNDYQRSTRRQADGTMVSLELPRSNVLSFELEGGSRVTVRPSGTEPKMKYYFDVKESAAPGEPYAAARARALGRLASLERGFLDLVAPR